MAKIESPDPAVFMNPSAYSNVKDDKKLKSGAVRKNEKTDFSLFFNSLLGKTAENIGPLQNLPVSDESVNILMDEVRDKGDKLLNRPLPEEIIDYKQAVRNFINYVVKNNFSVGREVGIMNKYKPGFKGNRNSPSAENRKGYTTIEIIDRKLEDLAAMLLSNQGKQLELAARLEEIKGLLIDLMQ